MALAVNSLIAAIHNPVKVGRRVYAIIGCFFAVIGGVVAGRHVWLQSLPPDQIAQGRFEITQLALVRRSTELTLDFDTRGQR